MVKSIRLSGQKREDILDSVMTQWAENNKAPDKTKAEHELSEYYYSQSVNSKLISKLEEKSVQPFLKKGEIILVQVAQEFYRLHLKEEKPLKDNSFHPKCCLVLDKKPEIHEAYDKIGVEYSKYWDERCKFKSEVSGILDTVNTTRQLVELWPEIEKFLPAYLADPSKGVQLPAIPTSRLNQKLGVKNENN